MMLAIRKGIRGSIRPLLALVPAVVLATCAMVAKADQAWSYTYNSYGQMLTADGPRTDVSDVTTYTYDSAGNRTSIINARSHVVQLKNYNGRGQPQRIINAGGVITDLIYHVRGWLLTSTVKDPGGNAALDVTTAFGYDNVGQLTSISLADGTVLNYEYDAAHRLTTVINDHNERIEYTFDLAGNRTGEIIKSDIGSITKSLTRTYDELSRLLSVVGASGQAISYAYDTNDNITSIFDGNNNQTTQGFDALGRLVGVDAPLSGSAYYAYDDADNLIQVTDPAGLSTGHIYDGFGNLTQLTSPDTGTTDYTYDEANNLLSHADANGVIVSYAYDTLNRLTNISYPNTIFNISYGYDAGTYGNGRLTSITDNSGSTALTYDHRGNLISHATSIEGINFSMGYGYNKANQLVQVVYSSGRTIDLVRDATGLIIEVVTTFGGATTALASNIDYQPFGPLTQLDFGNGIQITNTYDLDYRLTASQHSTVRGADYSYDFNNNITTITDNLNIQADQSFDFDALNRLASAAGIYGTLGYTYDENGNRQTVSNNTETDVYTYDFNSHRLLSTNNWQYNYDNNGNLISKLDSDGSGAGLLYLYDGNNRLIEVQDALTSGTLAAYNYNAYGQRVSKWSSSTGQTTYFVYNTAGQLLAELDGYGDVMREYVYLNGAPLAVFVTEQQPTLPLQTHTLDNDDFSASSTGTWSSKSGGQATNGSYRYSDSDGDTYRWTPSGLNANIYHVYGWWMSHKKHNTSVQYSIYHDGQIASVTRSHKINGSQWNLLGTFSFNGNGSEYIEVSDLGGKTIADGIQLMEAAYLPPTYVTSTYYIHTDHLGTPQAITDESQNVVWGADYEPFGEVSISINSLANNLRFPGQYFDEESNLYYNYFRYYDPSTGRYTTSDPRGVLLDFSEPSRQIAAQMGAPIPRVTSFNNLNHIYGYANQNPLMYTDPTGEFTPIAGAIGGAAAGFLGTSIGTLAASGSVSDAFSAGLDGALIGGSAGFLAGLCGGCAVGVLTGAGFGLLANGYTGASIANSGKEPEDCDK